MCLCDIIDRSVTDVDTRSWSPKVRVNPTKPTDFERNQLQPCRSFIKLEHKSAQNRAFKTTSKLHQLHQSWPVRPKRTQSIFTRRAEKSPVSQPTCIAHQLARNSGESNPQPKSTNEYSTPSLINASIDIVKRPPTLHQYNEHRRSNRSVHHLSGIVISTLIPFPCSLQFS